MEYHWNMGLFGWFFSEISVANVQRFFKNVFPRWFSLALVISRVFSCSLKVPREGSFYPKVSRKNIQNWRGKSRPVIAKNGEKPPFFLHNPFGWKKEPVWAHEPAPWANNPDRPRPDHGSEVMRLKKLPLHWLSLLNFLLVGSLLFAPFPTQAFRNWGETLLLSRTSLGSFSSCQSYDANTVDWTPDTQTKMLLLNPFVEIHVDWSLRRETQWNWMRTERFSCILPRKRPARNENSAWAQSQTRDYLKP